MFDIHCHILPEVDDGSRSVQESLAMLQKAQAVGIDTIMCTPHCRWDSFDKGKVEDAFQLIDEIAAPLGISLELGYEVNATKLMSLGIERAPEFALGDTGLFLLEFNDRALTPNWQRLIYQLQGMGLQVIIAHPERYRDVQKSLDIAREMKELGCYLQLSANFIKGGMLDTRRRIATALLKEDLIDYVASDAHRPDDYAVFAKALEFSRKTAS